VILDQPSGFTSGIGVGSGIGSGTGQPPIMNGINDMNDMPSKPPR
jgi:hypothetical protein